jgi:hypothetical protein
VRLDLGRLDPVRRDLGRRDPGRLVLAGPVLVGLVLVVRVPLQPTRGSRANSNWIGAPSANGNPGGR